MTKEQFKHQDINWEDKYYEYAIHKTDGGAIYLFQHDKDFNNDYNSIYTIRFDGVDLELFIENVKKLKENK